MADNTVFDSVFKTMVHKLPQLVVPFINEAFGRDYPDDEPIAQFNSEHEGPRGTTIADTVFRLADKVYHVECQSTPDYNMVVRMIEYDFAIALEGALATGEPYEMSFPESCVLFLRHTASTPDALTIKVNLPGGGSFDYAARVVKAQLFDRDEIFEKRLLILLPYYLMRYEGTLPKIAGDGARRRAALRVRGAARRLGDRDARRRRLPALRRALGAYNQGVGLLVAGRRCFEAEGEESHGRRSSGADARALRAPRAGGRAARNRTRDRARNRAGV